MATILVVDDFEDSRFSLCRLLELSGHSVLEATDGRQAIDLAVGTQPDLVLMDVSLPEVDGITATAEIRAREGIRQMPIVALSAHDTESYQRRAIEAGCQAYVTKPVDFGELEALIDQMLGGAAGPASASESNA
jgi:CheY-like chemotaxis protein